eukprot:CAMPEP_0119567034 /NCGR_PEP_ID=MMETSP1352-20130426/34778_1 /TAXON_ID=265584 /ORGANISM="Stauroneis constricta, Strain CCMP1120" /LENGTH=630 /DNA_ID=CAMNT_0007616229 /DNA_START=1 /DNA_END=1890 /DNA_ORIENTATION=+
MQARCYWLAASFYLWRSRELRDITESKTAEVYGIEYINSALDLLKQSMLVIPTPHLVSPGRVEPHWREISIGSLTKYRDDIQASSIVSEARTKFQEAVANSAERREHIDAMSIQQPLIEIGTKLYGRYSSSAQENESKQPELIDDFIRLHGDMLNIDLRNGSSTKALPIELMNHLPVKEINPSAYVETSADTSILSMLIICLRADEGNSSKTAVLFCDLISATIVQLNRLIDSNIGDFTAPDGSLSDSEAGSCGSDDEEGNGGHGSSNATVKKRHDMRMNQYICLLGLFINRLAELTKTAANDCATRDVLSSSKCFGIFESGFKFIYKLQADHSQAQEVDESMETFLFYHMYDFATHVLAHEDGRASLAFSRLCTKWMMRIISACRGGLQQLLLTQRDKSKRSELQFACVQKAQLIATFSTKLGYLLSKHPARVSSGTMISSELLHCTIDDQSSPVASAPLSNPIGPQEIEYFCDSLLWLWHMCCPTKELASTYTPASLERAIAFHLREPLAAALIGMCGAAASSRSIRALEAFQPSEDCDKNDPIGLYEFYDSDASVHSVGSGDGEDDDGDRKISAEKHQKDVRLTELLRTICHAVSTISNIFDHIDEKLAISLLVDEVGGPSVLGPLL